LFEARYSEQPDIFSAQLMCRQGPIRLYDLGSPEHARSIAEALARWLDVPLVDLRESTPEANKRSLFRGPGETRGWRTP
jgi:hypothetical protein